MYDLIGDIHGHATELEQILRELGYARRNGTYQRTDRKVVFLGDFIDRGPQIRETLEIVRPMVDGGHALAVMGNHEFNAIAYATPDPRKNGTFIRPHSEKNQRQHRETLRQMVGHEAEWHSHLDWFRSLPMWLDLNGVRAVHACWDETRMAVVGGATGPIDGAFLDRFSTDSSFGRAVDVILKGKEMKLPAGCCFLDKDGHERTETRTRWFEPADGRSYRDYALIGEDRENPAAIQGDRWHEPVSSDIVNDAVPYPADQSPVFMGHYWLDGKTPRRQTANVACLDWSVAKGGFLCGYEWNGEATVSDAAFRMVAAAGSKP